MSPAVKNIILRSQSITPDRLPGLAAWYSADYGVLSQVGGGTAFASASSQYLSVADNASLDITSTITLAGWIKTSSASAQYIINKTASGNRSYAIWIEGGLAYLYFSSDGGLSNVKYYRGTASLSNGAWHHVAATFDAGTTKLYVDGTELVGGALVKSTDAAITSIYNSTVNLFVGSLSGTGTFSDSSLDEIIIAGRAMSASEITWLYNSGAGRTYSEADASMKTNLVSWWSMNAPASGDWQDQHGTNHLTPSVSGPTATEGVTFNAATDGQTVRRWLDRSGNGRHLDQATLANQPTWSGGLIVTDGVTSFMNSTGWSVSQPLAVAVATNPKSAVGNRNIFDAYAARFLLSPLSPAGKIEVYAGASIVGATGGNGYGIFCIHANTTSSVLRKNQQQVDAGNIGTNALAGLTLSARSGGVSEFLAQDLREIMFWVPVNFATEAAKVERYLARKWGTP